MTNILKLTFTARSGEQETRRFNASGLSFEALVEEARRVFRLGSQELAFRYLDDERDLVTVTSSHELREAFDIAARANAPTLRASLVTLTDNRKSDSAPSPTTGGCGRRTGRRAQAGCAKKSGNCPFGTYFGAPRGRCGRGSSSRPFRAGCFGMPHEVLQELLSATSTSEADGGNSALPDELKSEIKRAVDRAPAIASAFFGGEANVPPFIQGILAQLPEATEGFLSSDPDAAATAAAAAASREEADDSDSDLQSAIYASSAVPQGVAESKSSDDEAEGEADGGEANAPNQQKQADTEAAESAFEASIAAATAAGTETSKTTVNDDDDDSGSTTSSQGFVKVQTAAVSGEEGHVSDVDDDEEEEEDVNQGPASAPAATVSEAVSADNSFFFADQLQALHAMGFYDDEENVRVLQRFNGRLERTVNFLAEN